MLHGYWIQKKTQIQTNYWNEEIIGKLLLRSYLHCVNVKHVRANVGIISLTKFGLPNV